MDHDRDLCEREIAHLREVIDLNDQRYKDKFDSTATALKLAAESANGILAAMHKQIELLTTLTLNRKGRDVGVHAGWGYAIGVVGLVLSVLALAGKL